MAAARMRIGWATPLNQRSPIAGFSRAVTTELARLGFAVEILRIETGRFRRPAPSPIGLSARAAESLSASELRREFDLVVVNLADDYRFHGGAMAILRSVAALILFHDAAMAGFLVGWARAERVRPEALIARFGEAIGKQRGTDERRTAPRSSELAWFAALGGGAVVHGDDALAAVRAHAPGPVAKIGTARLDPGAAARDRAVHGVSAKAYVDALVPHMEACLDAAPVIAAGRGLGRMLAGLGVETTDPAAARIGDVLAGFFGNRGASGGERG